MENQTSMDEQFLQMINNIIEENLSNEHFSVEDMADQAGLSRSMLHRKLKKLTGKSASDLLTETRLIRAKEFLEGNVATAAEISYQVGFNSPSYFNRVFKKHFGIPPGEIRKGIPIASEGKNSQSGQWISGKRVILAIILLCILGAIAGAILFTRNNLQPDKSIAILPFDNLSPDKENQYFADGVAEDLLNRLSGIGDLKVISRTSSEVFRDKGHKTIPEIAKILGVSYILEGTVQRNSNIVRINVQLIDAVHDKHIWSERYDRDMRELFHIQSEIAEAIADELSLVLTQDQKKVLSENKTTNIKALEYYQLGHFHASKRWIDGYQKSIEYFQKAIEEDPDYGLTYAGLSDTYHLLALQGWMDRQEGIEKSIELAKKALDLDPALAEAYAVMGDIDIYVDHNWEEAEKNLRQALKLNPNYATAHQYYSELLSLTGRIEQARKHMDKAIELDPFSFVIRFLSGENYYYQGQLEKVLEEFEHCNDLIKDHAWVINLEFEIYYQLGMETEALESFKRYQKHYNNFDPDLVDSVYTHEGLRGLLEVKAATDKSSSSIARGYALLGEYTRAVDTLKKAHTGNRLSYRRILFSPLGKLVGEEDFIRLLEEMDVHPAYLQ